ncbi:MAG: hypothetical protein ACRDRE_13145 [Pseudonocardiaceae bacterium]
MNELGMYWIYDVPGELAGLSFAVAFIVFAIVGVFATRRMQNFFARQEGWREHVVVVLEGAFVFFGLLLALVAIAAYDNYTDARAKAAVEASELGSLYRIVSIYPEPARGQLQADLREYTSYVIEQDWPLQRRGEVPSGGVSLVTNFQNHLASFGSRTNTENVQYGVTLLKFNDFVRARQERLHLVEVRLPTAMWEVLIFGTLLTIAITWLLPVASLRAHLLLSGVSALVVSLSIFVTAAMDNPFRGDFSVAPHAFEIIQHDLMSVSTAHR